MDDMPTKGGKARAAKLSPERRKAIAAKAAAMRWAKPPTGLVEGERREDGQLPPSPFAKYQGVLALGGTPVDVYVLDTRERVISLRATVKAIAGVDAGNLGEYIGAQALRPFLNKELVLGETRISHTRHPTEGQGYHRRTILGGLRCICIRIAGGSPFNCPAARDRCAMQHSSFVMR